ncbi:hypothetical protein PWT90_09845 [Aphanocladium album]|nr:hypothetical protein PWT90_09845 [Aphanocladium album]
MHIKALNAFFLLLEITSLANAAVPPYVEKRYFKVERVRNEAYTGRNGPRALAKVYRKYGMPLPEGLVNALEAQDKNEAASFQPTKRRAGKWQPPAEGVDKDFSTESASASAGEGQGGGLGGLGGLDLGGILGDLLGGGEGGANGNDANNQGGNRGGKGAGKGTGKGAGQGAGNGGENQEGNRGGNGNGNGANNGGNGTGNGAGNGTGKGAGKGADKGSGKGSGNTGNNGNNNAGDPNDDVIAALARAREGNLTGIVQAVPERNDVEYLSQVKIGGQPVTLDFDTGSSDLWVFNTQLSADQIQGRPVYDPSKSKTFKEIQGAKFQIRYGDGSGAEGNVGTDVVEVGGAVAPQQAVELATAVTDTFVKDTNNGGLLGLAFGSINAVKPQKQKTFFENVMPSLQEPVFTADLRANAPGAYEFGRIDAAKFTGQMAWIPVDTSKGFWQFSSQKFAVDGGQPQQGAQGGQAIADTGTTLILADPTVVEGYYAKVPQAQNNQQMGGFVVPCNAKLPDLDLDIGGVYMARIKGSDINFAPVGNGGKSSLLFNSRVTPKRFLARALAGSAESSVLGAAPGVISARTCFGGLQATTPGGMGVYGDIMFKSQFVAFNGGNNSLGMANHV